MNDSMARSEPMEQCFATLESAEPVFCLIEGTDVIEKGSLKVEGALEAFRNIIDPELGINTVDLSFVYGISTTQGDSTVLGMTLTPAACPLTDVTERQAQVILSTLSPKIVIS